MAKKRISIKDIAEVAGVSHPTVSRALRGQGRMTESTRERILDVAKDLGYTPSLMARGLVMQRSFCVGLIVPTFSDPFHSEVAQGVEEWARSHHYSLFVSGTELDPVREMEVAYSFLGRQVDGIIVSSSRVGDRYVTMLEEADIPIVLINSEAESKKLYSVAHDDYGGGVLLMQHLLQQGYRKIAYIGTAVRGRAHQERKRAWADCLRKMNLEPELYVESPAGTISGGRQGGAVLLQKALTLWNAAPDAIYCYNDAVAVGAIAALREAGCAVPDHVAVTGFDDLDIAAAIEPSLTTIHQPRREMGVRAMQMLLSLIDQIHPTKEADAHAALRVETTRTKHSSILVPGHLIIRRSA